ncbi:MAG: AcrR family transcriptional regulator [Arenicella sp.]|jgi:AcrR family transcriptional regulator
MSVKLKSKTHNSELASEVDGRTKRGERSRQLIIDAMLALIDEGNLIPTAQQVADRAGVAIRTVFRHFSEMEKLFAEMDSYLQPTFRSLFAGGDRGGSLQERVLHAVECHAHGYTKIAPVVRSTLSQIWRWPVLKTNYDRNQQSLRRDLDDWLPELAKVSQETREVIDTITSFEFWDRLQSRPGINLKTGITLISQLVLDQLYTKP